MGRERTAEGKDMCTAVQRINGDRVQGIGWHGLTGNLVDSLVMTGSDADCQGGGVSLHRGTRRAASCCQNRATWCGTLWHVSDFLVGGLLWLSLQQPIRVQ